MKAKVNVKNMFVCIFLGVLWLFVAGRMLCHFRQEEYEEKAGGALKEALLQELELRKNEADTYSGQLADCRTSEQPDSRDIRVTDYEGKRTYKVSTESYRCNISNDGYTCSIHSFLMRHHPLEADTLYGRWQNLLSSTIGGCVQAGLRLTLRKGKDVRITCIPADKHFVQHADSVWSHTVGYVNELEVTVLAGTAWYRYLCGVDWVVLLLGSLLCPGLYLCGIRLFRWCRCRCTRREVVEKEVFVAVGEHRTEVYKLDENVRFDVGRKLIYNVVAETTARLKPLEAHALKCLLESDGYALDCEELIRLLWPDEKEVDIRRLHSTIGRLRKIMSSMSNVEIQCRRHRYYLIFPSTSSDSI